MEFGNLQTARTKKLSKDKLAKIIEATLQISSVSDTKSLTDLVSKQALTLFNATKASVFLYDDKKQELYSIVSSDGAKICFDARLGLAGACALSGKPINVKNAREDLRFYKKIDENTGTKTKSMMIVPIRGSEDNVIGTFQVINKKSGHFTSYDVDVLNILSEYLSSIIQKSEVIAELLIAKNKLEKEKSILYNHIRNSFSTHNIIGENEKIRRIIRLIEQISDTSLNALITGESGTGKELVAKALHYNSPRAHKPFMALNCAAIPESLIESLLFGVEKGVATGVESRAGKFEEANGGTLFLDEIGDLSIEAQAKILRILQDGIVQRIGGNKPVILDVRVLAATNKDLELEIKNKNFREDLYYRLKVIEIKTPPLRDIKEDIPLFVDYFMDKYCKELKKEYKRLDVNCMNRLMGYRWPGNIRELENIIKRLVATVNNKVIKVDNLPEQFHLSVNKNHNSSLMSTRTLRERIEALEINTIKEAMELCRNNQQQAAKLLGLSRQGLINKIKRYGI